jgi:predicted peptidase
MRRRSQAAPAPKAGWKPLPGQHERRFVHPVSGASLRYLLYVPRSYTTEPDRRWPLILFLHGAGEAGDDLELVKELGPPRLVEELAGFPFVLVSPQCPPDTWWRHHLETLGALLDEIEAHLRIDPARIYLTGASVGGYGTWMLAMRYPERFAAIVPVCGGGNPLHVHRLRDVPVWAFHGALDPIVPMNESEKMVSALRDAGGDVRYTVYPEVEHDAWTLAYAEPALYDWMLSHRLQQRRGGG